MLGREPLDDEIDAEVAKELKRISEQKNKGRYDASKELEEVRTRMLEMEGSVMRLEEKVTSSQQRIEDMLKDFLLEKRRASEQSVEYTVQPPSSVQVIAGTEPMSQGTAAWTTVQSDFLLPMLKSSAPHLENPVPVADDIATDPIPVEENVVDDVVVAGADKDVVGTDVTTDVVEPMSTEGSKFEDVVVVVEEGEIQEEEDDAYALPTTGITKSTAKGVAPQAQSSSVQEVIQVCHFRLS